MKKRLYFLFIVAVCIIHSMVAQTFPVTVVPQTVPPAPIYLSSYADASTINSPLRVQIILNDFSQLNREIRLKTFFEGNGIQFESNDIVVGAPTLFLEGGIPLNLTNIELAPYFAFENITGISPTVYGQPIPEGSYQFCFEVYDVLSGAKISQKTCANTFIFQNEPPLLIAPNNRINLQEQNPLNLLFQWTPRHINVTNVQYELSIVEIWDLTIDPQAVFLASPPIFQTTTTNTSYLYSSIDPLLISNKRYAWRVQAKSINGSEEIGLFNNNGFSEVFWFNYTAPCEKPTNISHEVKGAQQANINWEDFTTSIPEFTVRYREKGQNNEWFYTKTTANWTTIWDLQAGTTYEYQLNKTCLISESEYSIIQTFTTLTEDDEEGLVDCGISPDLHIENMEPLEQLAPGGSFIAGDFPIKVTEASGSNGRFTGKGYVTFPYFNSIKIAVNFTNVFINTENKLAEGTVVTVYDDTWGNILDIDEVIDIAEDIADVVTGDDTTNIDITYPIDEDDIAIVDGEIVITKPDGSQDTFDYDEGDTHVIKDSNGNEYTVQDGEITQTGEADASPPLTAENTDGISTGTHSGTLEDPRVDTITNDDVTVTFRTGEDTKYALDLVNNDYERQKYPKINTASGSVYYPPHKAAIFGEGNEDVFYADIKIHNPAINIDSLLIKTATNAAITHQRVPNTDTYKITVKAKTTSYNTEECVVTYLDPATKKYKIAANFFIHDLVKQKEVPVQVVRVGGSNIADLETGLNDIFGPAGGRFKVNPEVINLTIDQDAWDTGDKNGIIDYDGSGILSDYPTELKNIYQEFKKQYPRYDSQQYFIFVLGKEYRVSKALSGFMPKTRQWGFVFESHLGDGLENKNSPLTVAAHELGHGVFTLEHPFGDNVANAGNADTWLMDYGTGTELGYPNWATMNDADLDLFLFQDDSGGEFAADQFLYGNAVAPGVFNRYETTINTASNGKQCISFISPTNKLISIPITAEDITFYHTGSLYAFTVLENGKLERYVASKGTKDGQEVFMGYLKSLGKADTWKERVFQDNVSRFLGAEVTIHLGKLKKTNNTCGIDLYKKEGYTNNVDKNEWNNGGRKDDLLKTDQIGNLTSYKPNINSPEACDLCDEGNKFYNLHANITDQNIQGVVLDISKLICDPDIDTTFFEEFSKNEYKSLLDWQKKFYSEGLWPNDYDAYYAFHNAYNKYIEYYKEAKEIIKTSDEKEALLRVAYNLSLNQLETLTAEEKLGMLKVMTEGFVGGYWFGLNYNIEALALKIIKSVNNNRGENDQTKKFLEGLLSETYKVKDKYLYENLFKKLDDYFGDDNFSELILAFTKLSLETYPKTPSAITVDWGAKNKHFFLDYVVSDTDFEFDFEGKQVYVTGECLEKRYTANRNGQSVEDGCREYLYDNHPLHPFNDFVTLTILEDTNILPTYMCGHPNVQWCGKAIKVPAVFLPYLQEKKRSQSFENWGINTIVVVGTILSAGEVSIAKSSGQISRAFWEIADLTYTFSNEFVYLFYEEFDDKTDNEEFKDYFKSGWDTIGYMFLAKSAADITGLTTLTTKKQIARGYAAIKTYGEDEFFEVFEESLKKASEELGQEQIKAISSNIRKSLNKLDKEIPDIINEELGVSRKIYSGTGNFKNLIKNNIFEKLGDGAQYKDFKKWINDIEDSNLLNKLETISGKIDPDGISDIRRLGDDFDGLIQKGIDFTDLELLAAWSALSRSPIIRAKPENIRILKKVHNRFEYGGKSSFDGINQLLNEGSQASRQKIIDGLQEVNDVFDSSLPVKFSGIKKGDVKVTIIDANGKGDEVARFIDGILKKKKVILDGDGVTIVKKGATSKDDDILRKGDEIGFREISDVGDVTKWVDDLESVLGVGSKTKIQGWLDEGLEATKVEQAFGNSSNKSKLFSDLNDALSIQHRRILVNDLDNVPGLSVGNRIENSYPNGHVLENTKATLLDGSFDPDLSITYSGDVMSFVNGTADLVQLPAGTKLYRVCNDGNGAFTGGYWTRTKPNNLDEVIGNTAVQPEWNSFDNIIEYTVPNGKEIWVWEGNAASQKLSNNLNLSNPHLAGGGEQILIPLKYRRIKKSDGTFDFGGIEQSFLDNIVPLSNNQIPWK